MKKFNDFRIKLIPFLPDLIGGALWTLPLKGIEEHEEYIDVYTEEGSGVTKDKIKKILDEFVKRNILERYEIYVFDLDDRNWNAEWEKNVGVIEVSERIVIKPSFKDYSAEEGQIILEIDPKMSFGTGEHETTRLMLRLLEKYLLPGAEVLDLGSGTAVLSICAAKLGAKKVLAVDNNEWCYVNGLENTKRNNVTDKVEVKLGELKDVENKVFDLVLANINKNVLLEIRKDLVDRVSKGGFLILSGILKEDKNDIIDAYSKSGVLNKEIISENEWIGAVFKKA